MALKTIQLGEETELNDVISMGCRHAGDVYTRLGALDAASQYYERGAMTGGKHFFGLDNSIHLGFVLCMSGQLETGHQILANLRLATSKIFDLGLGVLMSEFFLSMVYAFEGEWEQAGHLAHKVKDTAHLQNVPTYYYDAILLIGDIAFHNGDLKQAIECFQMAAEDARSRGNLWSELSAQTQLVQIYTQTNNPNTDPAKRLDHLMSELENNCKSDALREIFLAYKNSIYKNQTSP